MVSYSHYVSMFAMALYYYESNFDILKKNSQILQRQCNILYKLVTQERGGRERGMVRLVRE